MFIFPSAKWREKKEGEKKKYRTLWFFSGFRRSSRIIVTIVASENRTPCSLHANSKCPHMHAPHRAVRLCPACHHTLWKSRYFLQTFFLRSLFLRILFFFCENTSCLLLLLPPFCMSAVTAQPTSCAAEIVCENHSLKQASKLVHFLTGFIFPLNLRGSGSPGKKKRGIKKTRFLTPDFLAEKREKGKSAIKIQI